tara:strand:+ start:155 stop:481 length:327 start_codon:yes stop_codon:yes gene_type:complete
MSKKSVSIVCVDNSCPSFVVKDKDGKVLGIGDSTELPQEASPRLQSCYLDRDWVLKAHASLVLAEKDPVKRRALKERIQAGNIPASPKPKTVVPKKANVAEKSAKDEN